MELAVSNLENPKKKAGNLEVTESVCGKEYNESLVHQVVTAYQAGSRSGTKRQKSRAEASGGGIKPWRQKGTGRARAGSIRSPIWVGGGRAFAARPQDHSVKVNKKMYRGAMACIVSELIRQERLVVVADEALNLAEPKTKSLLQLLKAQEYKSCLLVTEKVEENLHLASRNIPKVDAIVVTSINPLVLVAYDKTIITSSALKKIEEGIK